MAEKVIVTVNEGKVRGFKTKSPFFGTEYYSFLGVPYGQSTAGLARFKDPVKVKPWNNIWDGTIEKQGCTQFSLQFRKILGSEDCLYNNIHTPKIPSNGDPLKAVIVNIHPGGFFHGSPDPSYYGSPQFIMHHDIVYVCVGYRLHVLGNLNLGMKSCSGNQSLKDIILSLQWIKDNISVFGGDPENITLMGSSSGSASVHFLLLSPLSEGLFHKAILMGMYVFSPVLVIPDENTTLAYELAKNIGYIGKKDNKNKLFRFYQQLNLHQMILSRPEQYFRKTTLQVYPTSMLLPSGESSENSPLPVSPVELIPQTKRIPMIIGFCEREAAMALAILRTLKRAITDSFCTAIRQNSWSWGANLNDDELKRIQKEVENFYLEGNPIDSASQEVLCDILTDAALSDLYDTLINVVSTDNTSSVYVYNFLYDGKLCMMKRKLLRGLEKELKGAFHAADYAYWSYATETSGKNMECTQPKDREIIEMFTSILTTFAKTGNPNDSKEMRVHWKPTTPEHPSHLVINKTPEVRDEVLNGKRLEFWHELKRRIKNNCNNE